MNARINEKMNMEHCWNDSDQGELKYVEKNVLHFHCVQHKFHMG